MRELIGYASHLSAAPGESVSFMVSTSEESFDVQLVRLVQADTAPNGPGAKQFPLHSDVDGPYPGRRQAAIPGSYLIVENSEPFSLESFTLQAWIAPTTVGDAGPEAIVTYWSEEEQTGYGLFVDAGAPVLWLGSVTGVAALRGSASLDRHNWFFVAATYDLGTCRAAIEHCSASPWNVVGVSRVEGELSAPALPEMGRLRIAAAGNGQGIAHAFNGKIDSPSVYRRALTTDELARLRTGEARDVGGDALVAAWDFAINQSSLTAHDSGGGMLHARAVNMPARGVTGRSWAGREVDFRSAPNEYSAIDFHSDDLADAAWTADFEWHVPATLKSGVYAAELRAGELVDHIPVVITPGTHSARTDILVLLPTFTYLAYANERVGDGYSTSFPPGWVSRYDPLDRYLDHHPEFGKSLYDVHDDLTGVQYSSALRPIPNLRPGYRHRNVNAPRHLAGDLYLIDWLEVKGFSYDVVGDGDLHRDGRSLIDRYRVVVTGGHPEYWTAPMLESLESWVHDGGRLMYLGGNGFYWVTSVHPEAPHVIEVRRGIAGSRPWESEPGELHHSTTGEPGGLWRYRGKLPNRLTGVGFGGQGSGASAGYTRTAASDDPRAAWIFDGVGTREDIGSYGLVMGGAAGDEVDRVDVELGTPVAAIVLASTPVLPYYGVALEDARAFPGPRGAGEARADMVLLRSAGGGAVFSVGSISWSGALSHNIYGNDVSRITENVLRRFVTSSDVTASGGLDER
jgi:N,N-dimethylformamidase